VRAAGATCERLAPRNGLNARPERNRRRTRPREGCGAGRAAHAAIYTDSAIAWHHAPFHTATSTKKKTREEKRLHGARKADGVQRTPSVVQGSRRLPTLVPESA